MTKTPWGRADELRSRRLPPGPSKTPELALNSQRERLLAATVSVVAEKGYEATRVADIVEVSGVSRSAFYKHFANKQDCFLATLDAITSLAVPTLLATYENAPGPWDRRLGAMLGALVAIVVAQPAATRLAWVEVYAAGPDAVSHIEQFDEQIYDLVQSAMQESPERAELSRDVIRAITGGLRKIVNTYVRRGRQDELPALVPDLVAWALSYQTPPQRLKYLRTPPPGLVADLPQPRDARERILSAVIEIVAEGGYQTMKITDIAQRGAVSLTTFYDNFSGKEEVFVAAIERWRDGAMAAVMPVYQAAADWPHAVAAGLHAFFAFFALNPAIARLGGVVAYEGGEPARAIRDDSIAAFNLFLEEGYRLHPSTPSIGAEAIGSSIYALMNHQLRHRGPQRLYEVAPTAAFIALAPFLGSEDAAAIANEKPASLGRSKSA